MRSVRAVVAALALIVALPPLVAQAGVVTATVETDPVLGTADAADDPAIWIHPSDPSLSTVIGTDKTGGGLAVYDLAGHEIQFDATVKPNNVDLRYNFALGGTNVALVTFSDKRDASIGTYRVDPFTRRIENVEARDIVPGINPKGICMYRSPISDKTYVFAVASEGTVEQWELFDDGTGRVDGALVRSFVVGTTSPTGAIAEACVVDDAYGDLYVSEERVGIWRYGAEPGDGDARVMVDTADGTGHLQADVEGLAVFATSTGGGYLIASSQGDDRYTVYERPSGQYLGDFQVGDGAIDGVTHTDGLDVTNFPLGPSFPDGMFVAQDDENPGGNQNFKLVQWGAIARSFGPALQIDTAYDPRTLGGGGVGNRPPFVDAGPGQTVLLGDDASLDGRVADDGLPSGTLTRTWAVQTAPGGASVTFGDPAAEDTTAAFSVPGDYVLALTGADGVLSTTDTVAITVVEGISIDVPIAASSDDAEESSAGVMSLTSSDLEIVYSGGNQTIGLRFVGTGVPRAAVVTSAWIQFETDELSTGATSLTIQGQAADHATTFTTATADISSRPRTAASVGWIPAPWSILQERGPAQRTPSLVPIVQEVVNRPGWSGANALAFVITGTGERVAEAFNGTAPPVLHLEYRMGGPIPNAAPSVDAGPDRQAVVGSTVSLAGAATDDGLPVPPGALTVGWTQLFGPGTAIFGAPGSPTTTVSFPAPGSYVLELTASDGELSASDTVTVVADDVVVTEVRISNGIDDVEEKSSGSVKPASDDIELVYDGGNQTIGLRFVGVPVPQGARIARAYVQFQVDEVRSGTVSVAIQAHDVDDAPGFTTATRNVSSRVRTTASVPWLPVYWPTVGAAGPDQRTPDLSTVVQEIVDRPGWASGRSLALIITGTGRRVAEAFEGSPAAAPLLHIEYR